MISFIGTGIMGNSMAGNLLKEGHELTVYNRTKEKAQNLLDNGAAWADSPKEAAAKSSILFSMLTNPSAVEKTALGENGFLAGMKEGSLWIDCSTVPPDFSRKMAEEAAKRGIRFLDAPVAGSKIPAEKGELVFLVGGKEEDLKEAEPLLNIMGKAVKHQGENGKGTSMKLVINLTLAQAMAAFSEAVALGEAMELDKETVLDTLLGGATAAPFLQGKKSKLLENSFNPEFPLEHMQKDLHLVSEAAYNNGISLPLASAAKELYGLAKQQGFGQDDFSSVYAFIKQKK
ncbi:NAD(P)-dependent oxidoreductase [Metabacillus sp. GX 13764]|uniref:NAD(P)-dependent oxidoreductase n=1 Tax=Metabacillus kandeliae TaxID=2900151 RepID=UPI001E28C4DC|nr:NAD(P)-dependent oxidoreductase [Metabacillus kandeliae]MCD7034776.1 NAD(P)-dependent oxidoreductase [Metabacillus kandeliae]